MKKEKAAALVVQKALELLTRPPDKQPENVTIIFVDDDKEVKHIEVEPKERKEDE